MIQIRNVPDWLHREIERRARVKGLTMTAFIQQLLEREVALPPIEEVFARLASHEPVDLGRPAAELIHEERAARTK
jgi:hypothetical protein